MRMKKWIIEVFADMVRAYMLSLRKIYITDKESYHYGNVPNCWLKPNRGRNNGKG